MPTSARGAYSMDKLNTVPAPMSLVVKCFEKKLREECTYKNSFWFLYKEKPVRFYPWYKRLLFYVRFLWNEYRPITAGRARRMMDEAMADY